LFRRFLVWKRTGEVDSDSLQWSACTHRRESFQALDRTWPRHEPATSLCGQRRRFHEWVLRLGSADRLLCSFYRTLALDRPARLANNVGPWKRKAAARCAERMRSRI